MHDLEKVYTDQEIRYFSRDYAKIPLTFLNTGDIPAGKVIGIRNDGYGERVRRTTLTAQAAAAATTLVVEDAALFKVGDTISIMNADLTGIEELGTVTAINAADKELTVATAVTAVHAVGSYVYASDGSEKAVGLLADPVIDEGEAVIANIYLEGHFSTMLLSGLDDIAKQDLRAREVAGITIIP